MNKLKKIWWIPFVILICIFSYEAWDFYKKGFLPFSESDNEQRVFLVQYGDSLTKVAKRLEKENLIRSELVFRVIAKKKKTATQIKPGEYLFSPSQSPEQILDDLVKGRYLAYELLIPEGYDIFDIAKKVDELGLDKKENFLKAATDVFLLEEMGINATSVEGYLFPAKYRFQMGAKSDYIIRQMVLNFSKMLGREIKFSELLSTNKEEMQKILILASIVEKESIAEEERPIIAGVFFNRLRLGMPLQADPTVIYGLKVTDKWDNNISKKDLSAANDYNTYTLNGLPKSPICNPGISAIKAVMNPKETKYLYFVSKNNGAHYFSKTLSEHNNAVNKYQKNKNQEPKPDELKKDEKEPEKNKEEKKSEEIEISEKTDNTVTEKEKIIQ